MTEYSFIMSIRRVCLFLVLSVGAFAAGFEEGAVVRSDGADFYRNTIPQIALLGNGQLFAVWSATPKKAAPGKVYGAFSDDNGKSWSAPRLLMSDASKLMADPNILVDGNRVLVFSTKVNLPNRIDKSWTIVTRSEDNGVTWSGLTEIAIPRQYVSGKQHNGIVLRDGTYMIGIAWDKWPEMSMAARTEGEMDLTAGVLLSKDGGKSWTLHGALHATYEKLTPNGTSGLCEPSFVELENGELFMLLRSGATHHYESRSRDGGLTWSTPKPSPLPGHNTPAALLRLRDNPADIVAVWNNSPLTRYPLSVARSDNGGKTWSAPRIIAKTDGLQVSYPGIAQASDGTLVAVWQQALPDGGRDIRYARFTPGWIVTGK
jgi:predicted neuraminidase